jgi:hypothetical protein
MPRSNTGAKPRGRHLSTREKWQRLFMRTLAETSNVAAAAERACVSVSWVYKLRRQDSDFARRWFAALCEGYENLEMELLYRLRNGKTTDEAGNKYDNAMALRLLTAHRADAARGRALREDADEQAVLDSIDAMIDAMRERSAASAALLLEDALGGGDEHE